jgi:replicative DNA helicase
MKKVVEQFRHSADRMITFDADTEDVDFAKSQGSRIRYKKMKQLRNQKGGSLFRTPWPSINKVIKFCRPEDLVVLVGRLGMGKSWMLIYWAIWLAEQGHSVLFMSKEMSIEAIEDRVEAIRYMLDFELFRAGELPTKEELRWNRMRLKKWKAKFFITGKETIEGTGVGELVSKIRKYKPQAVFADAAYRFVLDAAQGRKSETEKLTYIAQTLKRVAKSEKVLLVASTQMNREAEDKKGNTKGGVRTVFGADAWAQESDTLFEVFGNRNEPNLRGITILKSRESGTGSVTINFKLSPHPDFREASNVVNSNTAVKFKGI